MLAELGHTLADHLAPLAQPGRAAGLHPAGRRFKSFRAYVGSGSVVSCDILDGHRDDNLGLAASLVSWSRTLGPWCNGSTVISKVDGGSSTLSGSATKRSVAQR